MKISLKYWETETAHNSKSPLNIFCVNLFYVPHTQAKSPLVQSILRGKKKQTHNDAWKSTPSTATFSSMYLPHKAWKLSKKLGNLISVFSSAFFFFLVCVCAVDTFLIKLRCCLYFGEPLAASKTKQNSEILFQWDTEVSCQDKW